jgi:hypothetical protein
VSIEHRCPSCGALVAADAEWCGQCLRPLRVREPQAGSGPAAPVVRSRAGEGGRPEPAWACPSCEHDNPIALERCEVCGTPFAKLFAEPALSGAIAPSSAVAWSLAWPGLGHYKAGRRVDGVARMVLFAWTFGTVLVLLVSRAGLGRGAPLLGLYGAASLGIYALSAVDARRVAAGDEPVVGARPLLWTSVALIVLSIVLATLLTLPVARGG